MVAGPPGPATLCARTRKSNRAPVGRSFTSIDVRSVSPCRAGTHSEPGGGCAREGEGRGKTTGRVSVDTHPAALHLAAPTVERPVGWPGGGGGGSEKGALTALLAVLHTVAVQAASALALGGPPLEGHSGVRDVLHRQMGGFAGGAWADGRSDRGLSLGGGGTSPAAGFQAS